MACLLIACGPDVAGVDSAGGSGESSGGDESGDSTGAAPDPAESTGAEESTDGSSTGEAVDDESGDSPEPPPEPPRCGDGVVDAGEECDDGNTSSADDCDLDCVPTAAVLWDSEHDTGGGNACARAIAVGPGGDIAVAGWTQMGDDKVNAWVGVYDEDGELQWSENWDGGEQERDEVEAIAFDDAGDLYLAVSESNASDNTRLRRMTVSGELLWDVLVQPAAQHANYAADLAVEPDGTSTLLMTSYGPDNVDGGRMQRYSADGAAIWTEPVFIPLAPIARPALARGPGGSLMVSGQRDDEVEFTRQPFVDRYDLDGLLHWTAVSNPPPPPGTETQAPVVVGTDGDSRLLLYDAFSPEELVMRSWDDEGESLDTIVPGVAPALRLEDATEDSAGNLLVVGSNSDGAWAIKLAPDGTPMWTRRRSIPGGGADATATAIADNDDVLVAGCSDNGADAMQIWVRRYAS